MKIRPEFKRPIRISCIVLAIAIILVIVGATWIFLSESSSTKANRRAVMLGSGLGVLASLVVAPFWLFAAGKIGKERREQRLSTKSQREPKR